MFVPDMKLSWSCSHHRQQGQLGSD